MRNCLGLHYTTLLINFHLQKHGDKEVSMSTVNLAFGRIQPKITKIIKYDMVQKMRESGKRQRANR